MKDPLVSAVKTLLSTLVMTRDRVAPLTIWTQRDGGRRADGDLDDGHHVRAAVDTAPSPRAAETGAELAHRFDWLREHIGVRSCGFDQDRGARGHALDLYCIRHDDQRRGCGELVTPAALRHLGNRDPVMRALIRRVGPCTMRIRRTWSPFQSLVRAVVYQQLHGRAAAAIFERLVALFGTDGFPTPEQMLAMSPRRMRKAGLSRAKVRAIKDIARKATEGTIPTRRAVVRLADDEIIARLTEARGVGRWTVEMMLMFTLGRPDVLPVDDYGVRYGYRMAYGLKALPTPKALMEFGERWRPHRTTASWYLWRAAEQTRAAALKPRPASKSRAGKRAANRGTKLVR